MRKISTIIGMCILLLISVCCAADPTGREPQLMTASGNISTANTVLNTTSNGTANPIPNSTSPVSSNTTPNALLNSTTQTAPNTTPKVQLNAATPTASNTTNTTPHATTDTTQNQGTPNPAEILSGSTSDNSVMPPQMVISPDAIVSSSIYTLMHQNRVPGVAVALYVDGRPYLYHFGMANVALHTPVTENTLFEMGSVTKTFTTLLLGMELDEGKMHLHDSVFKYASSLQRLSGAVDYITLEELATHTSSLPFELPDYVIGSQNAFCNYLNRWRPGRPIGSTWQYSNIGFGLLGYMLEGATAETYDQLLHQRILDPLGMYHTEIEVPPQMENDYAQGYNWDGSPAKQWRHNDIIPAEGALKSTSQDMLKYLMASLGVPGTPADIFLGVRTSCYAYIATRYGLQGLAWEKHPLYTLNGDGYINHTRVLFLRDSTASAVSPNDSVLQDGNALIDKTGNTAGFTAYVALIPSHKLGVVILTNRAAIREQIGEAGRVILLRLLENNQYAYYKSNSPEPVMTAPTVAQAVTVMNVHPKYYAPVIAPAPAVVVIHTAHYRVHRHYVIHHHHHIVIVHEKVRHHVIIKQKIVVHRRHVKVVTKTVVTN